MDILLSIRTKWGIFIEDLPNIISVKFGSIWTSSFRVEYVLFLGKQKQELHVAKMLSVRSK